MNSIDIVKGSGVPVRGNAFADDIAGLAGSWHARSALMANADKVQELASKLPYMQFLK